MDQPIPVLPESGPLRSRRVCFFYASIVCGTKIAIFHIVAHLATGEGYSQRTTRRGKDSPTNSTASNKRNGKFSFVRERLRSKLPTGFVTRWVTNTHKRHLLIRTKSHRLLRKARTPEKQSAAGREQPDLVPTHPHRAQSRPRLLFPADKSICSWRGGQRALIFMRTSAAFASLARARLAVPLAHDSNSAFASGVSSPSASSTTRMIRSRSASPATGTQSLVRSFRNATTSPGFDQQRRNALNAQRASFKASSFHTASAFHTISPKWAVLMSHR